MMIQKQVTKYWKNTLWYLYMKDRKKRNTAVVWAFKYLILVPAKGSASFKKGLLTRS